MAHHAPYSKQGMNFHRELSPSLGRVGVGLFLLWTLIGVLSKFVFLAVYA